MEDRSPTAGDLPEHGAGGQAQALALTSLRPLIASAVMVTVLLTWMFWDFFERQVEFAVRRQADWGHTLVIPFVGAYFIYLHRERLLAKPFRTCWYGLVPIVLGIAWYILCNVGMPTLRHHNLMGLGACLTILGVVLLFFGWRATVVLLFPLGYVFVFGQTVSDRLMNIVTYRLQDITAFGSYILLDLGLDVDRQGNTLFIISGVDRLPLNIAEACSGMRMLMAFFAMGVFMAYTGLSRFWQQVLLVAMAIPTAIVVNILRVSSLGVLSLADVNLAAGDFHGLIGLLWLLPAFLMYLGIRALIRRLVIEDPGGDASPAPSASGAL